MTGLLLSLSKLWTRLCAWLKAAWAWFKQNWVWVIFPVGVALILLKWRNRPDVLVPEAVGATEVERKAGEKASEELKAAERARDEKLEEIEAEYREDLEELSEEQEKRTEKLRNDPEELNEFLLRVGKKLRKP